MKHWLGFNLTKKEKIEFHEVNVVTVACHWINKQSLPDLHQMEKVQGGKISGF